MKKLKLIEIEKQTDNRHLNLYLAKYEGMETPYQVASRSRTTQGLALISPDKPLKADAVRILPWYEKRGELYVVLIKEFRYAVGRDVYALPAGLIDEGETGEAAVARELMEETGRKAVTIEKRHPAAFVSPGMSDESVETYEVETEAAVYSHSADAYEQISAFTIKLADIPKFLSGGYFDKPYDICYQSRLQLEGFYYRKMYELAAKYKTKI